MRPRSNKVGEARRGGGGDSATTHTKKKKMGGRQASLALPAREREMMIKVSEEGGGSKKEDEKGVNIIRGRERKVEGKMRGTAPDGSRKGGGRREGLPNDFFWGGGKGGTKGQEKKV